jgi:hypothetical protein
MERYTFTPPTLKQYLPVWGQWFGYGNNIAEAKEFIQGNLPEGYDVNDLIFEGN